MTLWARAVASGSGGSGGGLFGSVDPELGGNIANGPLEVWEFGLEGLGAEGEFCEGVPFCGVAPAESSCPSVRPLIWAEEGRAFMSGIVSMRSAKPLGASGRAPSRYFVDSMTMECEETKRGTATICLTPRATSLSTAS